MRRAAYELMSVPPLRLLARAEELGCPIDDIAEFNAARDIGARWLELEATRSRIHEQAQDSELASRLFAGKSTLTDVLAEAGVVEARVAARASRIVEEATGLAGQSITIELRAVADRWVTKVLRPRVTAVVEPLDRLASLIPPGWSDGSVHLCSSALIRDAFGELVEVVAELDLLAALAADLVAEGFVAGQVHRTRQPFQFVAAEPCWSVLEAHRRGASVGLWGDAEVVAAAS